MLVAQNSSVAVQPADATGTETRTWQTEFERMLPTVRSQARLAFLHLPDDAREEATQSATCFACIAFAALFRSGRADAVTPYTLVRYAILRCRSGREIGQRRNSRDALCPFARRRRWVQVESMHVRDTESGDWSDILVEDRSVTPADIAICRIDFAAFFETMDRRRRQIARVLAGGESTQSAARIFQISASRISQIRAELYQAWLRYIGEESPELA